MENQHTKRPRLWMKFHERQDECPPNMRRTPDHRVVYRPPPPRRPPKKSGATGLGFRLNVTVCPKFDQISLAFSTILLILSLDLLVLTVLKVVPGNLSRKFVSTQCTVAEKSYANNSYCYIAALNHHHGKKLLFPCLQVYVRVRGDNGTLNQPSPLLSTTATPSVQTNRDPNLLLLYQNELHLAGGDYLHRPCSYLPSYCSGNFNQIRSEVMNYSSSIGPVNTTINCHYSSTRAGLKVTTNGVAMRYRVVTGSQVAHAVAWPIVGVIISVICCTAFWKKNHYRSHRLFIYNSWSPS